MLQDNTFISRPASERGASGRRARFSPPQTVSDTSSVGPDVKLAHCMLKIYVPGGIGAEGLPYHADDGSFVLGAIPDDEASGGRTVGRRNPEYVAPHKRHPFGGPALNELPLRCKTRASRSFCVRRWPFEYHTSCLLVSRRWPMMSFPSDKADVRRSDASDKGCL